MPMLRSVDGNPGSAACSLMVLGCGGDILLPCVSALAGKHGFACLVAACLTNYLAALHLMRLFLKFIWTARHFTWMPMLSIIIAPIGACSMRVFRPGEGDQTDHHDQGQRRCWQLFLPKFLHKDPSIDAPVRGEIKRDKILLYTIPDKSSAIMNKL